MHTIKRPGIANWERELKTVGRGNIGEGSSAGRRGRPEVRSQGTQNERKNETTQHKRS